MSWLSENLGTIVVGFLLAVIVIAIIRQQIHQKKQEKIPADADAQAAQCQDPATAIVRRRILKEWKSRS